MDRLIRVTGGNGAVRGFFCETTGVANFAQKAHETTPVVTAGLSRLLTATIMMGQGLKNDKDLITLTIRGDGPVQGLLCTANNNGEVKGYPYNNYVDIPTKPNGKLDVSGSIGEGYLHIIQDIGLKDPYTGMIPLVSGEIAEDITYYYAKSEQIPTSVALGCLVDVDYSVKQAGGFIVQLLPFASDEVIDELEANLGNLKSMTQMLDSGMSLEDICGAVFGNLGFAVTEEVKDLSFKCDCSFERVEKALITIGRKDIEEILQEDKKAEMHCHFCNTSYNFDEDRLRDILTRI